MLISAVLCARYIISDECLLYSDPEAMSLCDIKRKYVRINFSLNQHNWDKL